MKKFLFSLLICLLIGSSALLLIRADVNSRLNTGDMQKKIFSYTQCSEAEGRLELFGQVFKLDLLQTRTYAERAAAALRANFTVLPDALQSYGLALWEQLRALEENASGCLPSLSPP